MHYHLCIIYDGIANSVFESQVLIPFTQRIATAPHNRGLLISFEHQMPAQKYLDIVAAYPQITLIILPKLRFYGSISLFYAAYLLKKAIASYSIISAIARGPLAGWIIGHSGLAQTIPTIVQVRGLAGQEYAYVHKKNLIHRLRTYHYESVERWTYGIYARNQPVTLHAVSNALRSYLIDQFHAPAEKITVEQYDIPPAIDPLHKKRWRTEIRALHAIPSNAHVYVYSGSAKAWQCPKETVAYFTKCYHQQKNIFFLVLTQDRMIFEKICHAYELPKDSYLILEIPHTHMYHYLAATDTGIILREKHPINWVSRPTKILEYQAVGLTIIHNDTIAMLCKNT